MKALTTIAVSATIALLGLTATAQAGSGRLTSNTISFADDHPDSYRIFAPELPETRARAAAINTDFGLHVSEIEPGLFFVTDQVYQSAFVVTKDGVVVFDAPPSFGDGLGKAIAQAAPDLPITHLIMSHGHRDHNGGGSQFADIDGLEVIAAAEVAQSQKADPLQGVLTPTRVFDDALDLTIGGVDIELRTTHYHAENADVMIFLPGHRFLMAVDTITPGEVPFMNFGATTNLDAYLASFDTFLAYDFEHFLSGHVAVLGNRQDVIATRDYSFDVRDTVYDRMPSLDDRIFAGLEATGFENANLAYRHAIESIRNECAAEIIDRWQTKLSVVDIWADSHCETAVIYAIMH